MFTQGVTWNPVVGTYVFEALSPEDCGFFVGYSNPAKVMTHYESGKIVVVAYSGSFGFGNTVKAAKYVWTKVRVE